jgi:hypothetical protein
MIPGYWGSGISWENLYWLCERNELKVDGQMYQDITAVCVPYQVGDPLRAGMAGDQEFLLATEEEG